MADEYTPSKKPYSGGKWVVQQPGGTSLEFKQTAVATAVEAATLFAKTVGKTLGTCPNGRPALQNGGSLIPLQIWAPDGKEVQFSEPVKETSNVDNSGAGGGTPGADTAGDSGSGDATGPQ